MAEICFPHVTCNILKLYFCYGATRRRATESVTYPSHGAYRLTNVWGTAAVHNDLSVLFTLQQHTSDTGPQGLITAYHIIHIN